MSRDPLDLAAPARIRQALTAELEEADEKYRAPMAGIRDDWHVRQELYRAARDLRAAVEELRGPIRGEDGNELRCGVDGFIEQHAFVQGLLRFKVRHCQRRDRCPVDAISYGELRGRELRSVIDAAVSGRPWVHGWELEVTPPPELSDLFTRLVDAGDVEGVRDFDRRLFRVMQAYAWALLAPDREHRPDVGICVNLHRFHSYSDDGVGKGPLWPELYPHAHAYVPNERPGGGVLRRRAMFDQAELDAAREAARRAMVRQFGKLADLSGLGDIDVNVSFLRNDVRAGAKLAHRCRYQARSPWVDVAKLAMNRPEEAYSDEGMTALGVFADRSALLHRASKSQRYGGWLAPGKRRQHGLVRQDGEKSPWRLLDEDGEGYRKIVRYTPYGLIVRAPWWPEGEVQHVAGCMVAWGSNAPPKLWRRA